MITTVFAVRLLTVVIGLWFCDWPCHSQNVTATTGHDNATDTRRPVLLGSHLPCDSYYDHCSRPLDDNADGSGPRATGQFVPGISPERMNSTYFAYSRCYCDVKCRQYGDCCLDVVTEKMEDIEQLYFNGTELAQQKASHSPWECYEISLRDFQDTDIYVIGSCPSKYPHHGIQQRCERSIAKELYEYYLDIPVISLRTNITYVNIYCAICYNDSDVHQWSISIHCPRTDSNCTDDLALWKYLPGKRKWHYNKNGTDFSVTYQIAIKNYTTLYEHDYHSMFGARKCYPGVVDTCPSSWLGARERQLCAAYAFYIKLSSNGRVYKNKHCAKCHDQLVLEQDLQCPEIVRRVPKPGSSVLPSYSIIIDFGTLKGKVGKTRICSTKREIQCKEDEFCEPLFRVCHAYTCGSNYYMDATRRCIPRLSPSTLNTTGPDCLMNYIYTDEFVRQPDDSIYVNATGHTYALGKYEVFNVTTILVCINPAILNFRKFSTSQAILSTVCATCSLVCLTVHIAVHFVLPQLRTLPGMNLLCLSTSLFIAQFLFEFGFTTSKMYELCASIAVLMHYSFLTSFFWMNVMAIDVCRTFARRTSRPNNHREFWKYGAYAWLMPFFIVGFAICNDAFAFLPQFDPMYGKPLCWMNNRQALFLFFAAPLGVLLLENLVLFVVTISGIIHVSKMGAFARQSSSTSRNSERTRFLLYAKLAVIMGLTWVFGFIAAFTDDEVLWYLFIIFNATQGVFIFLAFTCKRKVYDMLMARFCHRRGQSTKDDSAAAPSVNRNSGTHSTNLSIISCLAIPTHARSSKTSPDD